MASYDRAIALKPDYAEAYSNRGNVLRDIRRFYEALANYDRAIALKPDLAEIYSNRGNALRDLKRFDEALASYERAIALKPDYAGAYSNRGNALRDLKRLDEALASYERAIALKPDDAETYSNRGIALRELRRLDEALASYDHAIALKADLAEAYSNRGVVLGDRRRFGDALASYGHAIALKPDYADAHWNESLIRLLLGDFELGWKKYEWRWECEPLISFKRNFTQPLWQGADDVRGKTILVHAEQGLGDTIQFCRYARMVHELGARVILEVPSLLQSLLTGLEGVDALISKGQALPAFDYHCPLLSLPLVFATRMDTIPAKVPYLFSDPLRVKEWERKLGEKRALRVGLVWSGSTIHTNDRNRSLPLSKILQGIPPEVSLYSLQKEVRESDRATVESRKDIVDFSEELRDFSDTAALIYLMDVVVCVDTAVAHLAGALGKRVWVLLPFVPDWRWLLDRDDSPWYPTMRLFRQLRLDDWGDVLVKVKNELIQIT
jgi:tetratricopeptide (TPR) repeat protein